MITRKDAQDSIGQPDYVRVTHFAGLIEMLFKERDEALRRGDEALRRGDAYRSMLQNKYTKKTKISREEWMKLSGETSKSLMPEEHFLIDTDWEAIDEEAAKILEREAKSPMDQD